MKKEFWIILICTIVLVVFLSYMLWFMNSHIEELNKDPIVYGARSISERYGGSLYCTCVVADRQFILTENGTQSILYN